MATTATAERLVAGDGVEHFDVLVIGAGVSGIGAAWHLKAQSPDRSFVVLEEKAAFGGTWVTHRYPGARSDSDLYTYGYRFKPWVGPPIATAEEIRAYMGELIDESGLAGHIRYHHRIETAAWSSETKRWTVTGRAGDGAKFTISANFLWMCQGYYSHARGHTPEWPGMADYGGQIVHPQTWPEGLDYTGKTVLVIGSGATAATIIPAMANTGAGHITMLQRSPTWFYPAPNVNEFVDTLRALEVDDELVHDLARRKANYDQLVITRRCIEEPEAVKAELLEAVKAYLGPDYDIATHFTPNYRPWQQRVALIPDGDTLQSIAAGKASVVTDEIERFTPSGVLLKSGRTLDAELVVTATGFDLCIDGGIRFSVDGEEKSLSDSVTYRGMMFTGFPNLLWVMGYFRASWTLRVDLLGDLVTRLLSHMAAKGASVVQVVLRPEDHDMPLLEWISEENFNPNYLKRGMHLLPKRGAKPEWMHNQDYWSEVNEIPAIDLDGAEFAYS